jgi:hypothetical protein
MQNAALMTVKADGSYSYRSAYCCQTRLYARYAERLQFGTAFSSATVRAGAHKAPSGGCNYITRNPAGVLNTKHLPHQSDVVALVQQSNA